MICSACRRPLHRLTRHYVTANKVSMKLVAELRKRTEASFAKVQEALLNTNNDLEAAQRWLQKDMVATGFKRATKLADREAKEGLIAYAVLSRGLSNGNAFGGVRAAMVELNCETDFASRNVIFRQLAASIAHTCAYMTEPGETQDLLREHSVEELAETPLMKASLSEPGPVDSSVSSAIRDTIVKLGENVSLRRAMSIVAQNESTGLHIGSYMHGTIEDDENVGKSGGLVALAIKSPNVRQVSTEEPFQRELQLLGRSVARQVVGFSPTTVYAESTEASDIDEQSNALSNQPFMTYPGLNGGQSVHQFLSSWGEKHGVGKDGIEVLQFVNWRVR